MKPQLRARIWNSVNFAGYLAGAATATSLCLSGSILAAAPIVAAGGVHFWMDLHYLRDFRTAGNLAKQGSFAEAVPHYEAALKLYQSKAWLSRCPWLYATGTSKDLAVVLAVELANTLRVLGNTDEAEKYLTYALERDSACSDAHFGLAGCQIAQHEFLGARRNFLKARALGHSGRFDLPLLNMRIGQGDRLSVLQGSSALNMLLGFHEESLKMLTGKKDPVSIGIRIWSLFALCRFVEADELLKFSTKLNPDQASTWRFAALYMALKAEHEDCIRYCRRWEELEPGSTECKVLLLECRIATSSDTEISEILKTLEAEGLSTQDLLELQNSAFRRLGNVEEEYRTSMERSRLRPLPSVAFRHRQAELLRDQGEVKQARLVVRQVLDEYAEIRPLVKDRERMMREARSLLESLDSNCSLRRDR